MTRDEIGILAAQAGKTVAQNLDEATGTEWRSICIVVDKEGTIIIGSTGLYAETVKDILLACLDTSDSGPVTLQ